MARRTAVLDDRQIRQMLGRFSGQRGLPNIGPVGGISPDYATPGTDKLLGRPVDPATGVQSPLTPSQISTALQELSRGSLKQYGLTERDIRRLYRGVNFNLSALSDPYLLNLVRSLLKQGLGIRQIMNDPSFTEYRQSLNEMRETGEQNMATDLSWVEKFRNINKDSFNALLLQNAMGTAAPVVGGGSGGGGGGGGGGRRYGGGGGGGGSGGGGNNPIGEIDVTKDATSNGIEYWPGLNETIRGMGSLPTGDRRALQAYFDRVDAFPNEQAKMRFLDIMGGGQKLPGESQEEYRARRQEAQKFTDLWVRSGGFKGGANAGINSIQDMQDAAQAASETLKARITKTEADAALADTRTRGDFDPRAQQRLMSQLGPRAQEQVTPEIAEYIAAKVARQRVLASQTIPRTAAPTDAELLADPQAASRGAYKPGGFQLDLAAINREVAADKAMREEGITPALLSYIQRSRGIPLAIDPYVGDIVTPRMAYLNQMRSKPDKSRRALATNKEDVDRLGFLYEAAQKFSPNNAAQLQSRTLRESSGEDWKDLPGHHLNDEPPTGPNAGPRDVASYFINSSPQGRRDSTPSARSSVSAVPSNTTPQYHLPQEQQSAPKYGYEQPGGYMAAVQPAIDAEAAKRAAAQRAAAIVAASYGPGSNSMGAAPYSPPSSSSSSSPQRAAAKVISAARKAITYGGGSPAVGITKPSNSLYRTINRY